jgi:ribonuclease Z
MQLLQLRIIPLLLVFLTTSLSAQDLHAQEMRVTLLGTGTPAPFADRAGPATLIEAGDQSLLIDAGRNVVVRLWQKSIPLRDIDAVFLTHFHHDHINGLADLWLTGWLSTDYGQRTVPLNLIGPNGTQQLADGLTMAYARNAEIRILDEQLSEESLQFAVQEFDAPALVYDQGGVQVRAFEVNHGEYITPSVGYRIDYGEHSVVISGDTTYDIRIAEAAKGVDLLIHEVMAWTEEAMINVPSAPQIAAHHTTPEQAGQIFSQAEPALAAYSHLILRGVSEAEIESRTRTTYSGPLAIGRDLMSFVISDQGVDIESP